MTYDNWKTTNPADAELGEPPTAEELEVKPDNRELIAALKLGEVACLNMLVFEPIRDNDGGWEKARALIRTQIEKLEGADNE
jgi:hypothetical protein